MNYLFKRLTSLSRLKGLGLPDGRLPNCCDVTVTERIVIRRTPVPGLDQASLPTTKAGVSNMSKIIVCVYTFTPTDILLYFS